MSCYACYVFLVVEDALIVIESCSIGKEVSPKIVKMSFTDAQDDKEVVARPHTTQV